MNQLYIVIGYNLISVGLANQSSMPTNPTPITSKNSTNKNEFTKTVIILLQKLDNMANGPWSHINLFANIKMLVTWFGGLIVRTLWKKWWPLDEVKVIWRFDLDLHVAIIANLDLSLISTNKWSFTAEKKWKI